MTLPHSLRWPDYPARFQFQPGAPCGGSSCCTDTCIQMIEEYYKEKTYTLAQIRAIAQKYTHFNEAPCTGINTVETLSALKQFGLKYAVAKGVGASFAVSKSTIGPVIVGVHYGSYPNWYLGTHPNRAQQGGRTDYGFTGAHAVLVLGPSKDGYCYTRDPDHNTVKPPYDRIKVSQLNTAMINLPRYTAFSQTFAVYPLVKKVL